MIAGGPFDREAAGAEAGGIGVLLAKCEDRAQRQWGLRVSVEFRLRRGRDGAVVEAGALAGAPGSPRLALAFDHLRHQGDGIGVEAWDRGAAERFTAEQQGFAEAEVIDTAGFAAGGEPGQVGGVAAGAPGQLDAEAGFLGCGESRERRHVAGVGGHAVLAAEVGGEAQQLEVGEGEGELHDRLQVDRKNPLAQVAEFHHQQHAMAQALDPGGGSEGA